MTPTAEPRWVPGWPVPNPARKPNRTGLVVAVVAAVLWGAVCLWAGIRFPELGQPRPANPCGCRCHR